MSDAESRRKKRKFWDDIKHGGPDPPRKKQKMRMQIVNILQREREREGEGDKAFREVMRGKLKHAV